MNSSIQQFFIRPQRQTYYSFDLGPNVSFIGKEKYIRQDFQISNINNHKLMVSYYHFEEKTYENCLIYLHTHNGSKLQALPLVEQILMIGMNVCLFDFAGYGNSQGQTVSLGCKQIWDIQYIINHLSSNYDQNNFILWGRSMGAVAALLYLYTKFNSSKQQISTNEKTGKMNTQLKVIGGIYDSPFYSLQKLILQLGSKNSNVPEILLKPFVYYIKKSLHQNIDFEVLEMIEKMEKIKLPGIFITSQNDKFIHYSHSQVLYKQYGGKKQLIYIQKDHNQTRKKQDLTAVYNFIKRLNQQYPKKWQHVLMNNLIYNKRFNKTIYGQY